MQIHTCSTETEFNSYAYKLLNIKSTDRIKIVEKRGELIPIVQRSTCFIRLLEWIGIWKPLSYRQKYVTQKVLEFFQANPLTATLSNSDRNRLRDRIEVQLYSKVRSKWISIIDSYANKIFFKHSNLANHEFFSRTSADKDLKITCNDGEIEAHSALLRKLQVVKDLTDDSSGDETPTLVLTDFSMGTVNLFLNTVYNDSFPSLFDPSDLFELYRLADFLKHEQLMADCDKAIASYVKKNPDFRNINALFRPELEGLKLSRKEVLECVLQHFPQFCRTPVALELEDEAVIAILRSTSHILNEDEVFNLVYNWADRIAQEHPDLTIKSILESEIDSCTPISLIKTSHLSNLNKLKLLQVRGKAGLHASNGMDLFYVKEPDSLNVGLKIKNFKEKLNAVKSDIGREIFLKSPSFDFNDEEFQILFMKFPGRNKAGFYLSPKASLSETCLVDATFNFKDKSYKFSKDFLDTTEWGFELTIDNMKSQLDNNGDLTLFASFQ